MSLLRHQQLRVNEIQLEIRFAERGFTSEKEAELEFPPGEGSKAFAEVQRLLLELGRYVYDNWEPR